MSSLNCLTELRFFPKELWDTIDPSRKGKQGSSADANPKRARLQRLRINEVEDEVEQRAENPDDDTVKNPDEDDDAPAQEEDPEDDFSEDDSEMGADYNAENYFDAGDDDQDADDGPGMDDPGFD